MTVRITGELAKGIYQQILSKNGDMSIKMRGTEEEPIIIISPG